MANDGFLSKCFVSRTPLKRGKLQIQKVRNVLVEMSELLFAPKFNPLTQAVPLGRSPV